MTIGISSDFDGGNITVLNADGPKFDLAIRHDKDSDFYQWFYFRVEGAAGAPLELRITNCGASAYPLGWENYRARVSNDGENWTCADTSYAGGVLTIRHTPAGGCVWFAYFAPFSNERHHALVTRIAAHDHVEHRVLAQTLDGRPIDLLTIGSGNRQIWLYARQHPGETMAEWWMEGALDLLVSGDPVAQKLLGEATFYVVPNMNPDGSARGHLRTNGVGVNLNREWHAPSLERSPEVWHVRAAMDETGVDFAMDIHGDEAIPYVFLAGFDGIPSWTQAQGDLYTRFASDLAARTADFQTEHGYPVAGAHKANLSMSTNQLAERFGAVSMTMEMPFKDNDDAPDLRHGWSPERSRQMGRDCLAVLAGMIEDI
ncbi:M14-type cytosolic carboxypeptidase [Sphingomonas sp.]|uniref:M14 family metallopeptidase n=1 Tax=Sphingomonas sp. TaxID=28214 RepID=UPI0025D16C47|nr:M14-type cytosolic carboxypeptidase [Sphingomonas sp.]